MNVEILRGLNQITLVTMLIGLIMWIFCPLGMHIFIFSLVINMSVSLVLLKEKKKRGVIEEIEITPE